MQSELPDRRLLPEQHEPRSTFCKAQSTVRSLFEWKPIKEAVERERTVLRRLSRLARPVRDDCDAVYYAALTKVTTKATPS
jgi:hypothetical protein